MENTDVTAPSPPGVHNAGQVLGYTTLRLAIGMSMLIHGLGRLPNIPAFTDTMLKEFVDSPLPPYAVAAFARVTPPVEALIGFLVFFGIATRLGLTCGGLWMVLLIFGSTLIGKYDVVGIQLIYSLVFFQLLQHLEKNMLSIDALIGRLRGDITPNLNIEARRTQRSTETGK